MSHPAAAEKPFSSASLFQNAKLDALLFKKVAPKQHFLRELQSGRRSEDGRSADALRKVKVELGTIKGGADSSAMLRWGDTLVICGARLEVAESSSSAGVFFANVEASGLCSPDRRAGPPDESAQSLSTLLNQLLLKCLRLDELVAIEGKLIWCLYLDVTCLNDDGALLSACSAAAYCALRELVIPQVAVSERGCVTRVVGGKTRRLELSCSPLSFSWGVVQDQTVPGSAPFLVCDLNSFEERSSVMDSIVEVSLDERGRILFLRAVGSHSLPQSLLADTVRRSIELYARVKGSLS